MHIPTPYRNHPCPAGEVLARAAGTPKVLCRLALQIQRKGSQPLYDFSDCDHHEDCDLWRRDKEVDTVHRRKRERKSLGFSR